MTLIIGIKCSDGIVLGADGAATYAVMGQPTIRQPTKKKLKVIDGQAVIGTSGPIGLGQRFAGELEAMWKSKAFSSQGKAGQPHTAMTEIRQVFWKHIEYETHVATCLAQAIGPAAIQRAITTTIVAIPLSHTLCLFQFDEQGAPEEASEDLPFVAIGSGQQIADPFLAFLRRIFWSDRLPTLSEGILSVVWTLHHAIETTAFGLGRPMQVITLSTVAGKPKATQLTKEQTEGENLEAILDAERKMAASFGRQPEPEPSPPPRPAQP